MLQRCKQRIRRIWRNGMAKRNKARTIGMLKTSGYKPVPVKEEMRRNLIAMIKRKKDIFPGIIGYNDTVIPQIENAIISGQDITFLGDRGQAESTPASSSRFRRGAGRGTPDRKCSDSAGRAGTLRYRTSRTSRGAPGSGPPRWARPRGRSSP